MIPLFISGCGRIGNKMIRMFSVNHQRKLIKNLKNLKCMKKLSKALSRAFLNVKFVRDYLFRL